MRVAVYGNLVYDHILTIDDPLKVGGPNRLIRNDHRAGGVANFCRAAKSVIKDLHAVVCTGFDQEGNLVRDEINNYCGSTHHLTHEPTSTAFIIVDKAKNERTSLVSWGACSRYADWQPAEADWHHFMYLDKLQLQPDQLRQFAGTISVDLCDEDKVLDYLEWFSAIDYLIVAKPSRISLVGAELPVRKGVIVHSPTQAGYDLVGGDLGLINYQAEANLNVLGAGDYFAAHCIASLIARGKPDLRLVHHNTLAMLRDQS